MFTVGQTVAAKAFTDCFGKHHERISNMTVAEVRKISSPTMSDYYRIKATKDEGRVSYVEAAARHFDPQR